MHKYAIEIFYSSDNDGRIAVVPELPGLFRSRRDRRGGPERSSGRHKALARNGGEGGTRDSFAPGESPPRRAGCEQDGGRLRISAEITLK